MLEGTFKQQDIKTKEEMVGRIWDADIQYSNTQGQVQYFFHNGEEEIQTMIQWNDDQVLIKEVGSHFQLYLELWKNHMGEGYIKTPEGMILFETQFHSFQCDENEQAYECALKYRLIQPSDSLEFELQIHLDK